MVMPISKLQFYVCMEIFLKLHILLVMSVSIHAAFFGKCCHFLVRFLTSFFLMSSFCKFIIYIVISSQTRVCLSLSSSILLIQHLVMRLAFVWFQGKLTCLKYLLCSRNRCNVNIIFHWRTSAYCVIQHQDTIYFIFLRVVQWGVSD